MNRLGCLLLLLFAGVAGGFFWLAGRGDGPSGSADDAPATSASITLTPSGLAMPVQGVTPAELVDSWGDARGGGTRAHRAIDIPAPHGTPVLAAADGRVEKIFESRDGGHTVYQRSADGGWIFYYAHLAVYAPGLTEGQALRRGQPVGGVGSTGSAATTTPHLHFEIHRMTPGTSWWQGEEINPFPILAGRASNR